MKNTKEIRVYWLNAEECGTLSGYDMEDWNGGTDLPDEALEFIEKAENVGQVTTLEEFMNKFNLEEGPCDATDFIFITSKY